MANDPSVNMAETMNAARHSSVSASLAYQRKCGVSETAKFAALGGDGFKQSLKRGVEDSNGNGNGKKPKSSSSVSPTSTTTTTTDGKVFNVTINMGGIGN